MEKHKKCLLCNSTKLKKLDKYAKDHLVKCRSCGFVFCEPIPTDEELTTFYNRYPYILDISPISFKRYGEILDRMEPFRKTNNLLDIGCGSGHFLEVAKARGWNVWGTEFTDKAIAISEGKGITFHKGRLDAANYEPELFDVVTSFEVIEHINNPKEDMTEVKKILRKGGLFYVTTPNFNSVSRLMLGAKWNCIIYPEHLSYYTSKTLRRFLKSQGFIRKEIQTTGISLKRFKQSTRDAATPAKTYNNFDEELREKIETKLSLQILKTIINGVLNFTRRGDSLKGYFIKR